MSSPSMWKPVALAVSLLALTGCAQMPTGPSVTVMPGPNKPFEVFVADDRLCRDWATSSSGAGQHNASAQGAAGGAVAGALFGAAVGAMASGGSPSAAGVGAAFGGVTGAAIGSDQGNRSSYGTQRRYDIAYQQCMYAKGNQIPGVQYAGYRSAPGPVPPAPPHPPAGIQPPPVR